MRVWTVFFSLYLTLSTTVLSSLESQVRLMESISELLNEDYNETLLVLDLDRTLFEAKTIWGSSLFFYYQYLEATENKISPKEFLIESYPGWAKIQQDCKGILIEDQAPNVLIQLQKQGIAILGLTSRFPIVAVPTLDCLYDLGFDLEHSAPSHKQLDFDGGKHPSQFMEGVIFASDINDKGQALRNYLDKIELSPKRIIFVDDQLRNVESLRSMCKETGIDYLGLHYNKPTKSLDSMDPKVARLQKKLYKKILSNQEATFIKNSTDQ